MPDAELGGYTVRVPALLGCKTQGSTLEEALANVRAAMPLYLEVLPECSVHRRLDCDSTDPLPEVPRDG
jgi:predicted RNase H-like HicB family nuclease